MTNANDTFWRQPKNAIIESIRPKNFFQCAGDGGEGERILQVMEIEEGASPAGDGEVRERLPLSSDGEEKERLVWLMGGEGDASPADDGEE